VESKIYTTLGWQSPEEPAAPSEIEDRSQGAALEVEPCVNLRDSSAMPGSYPGILQGLPIDRKRSSI
jgi:hypothetical protein